MKSTRLTVRVVVEPLPVVDVAGRFALADSHYSTRYHSVTHALHLHDYRALMRLGRRTLELSPGDATVTPAGVPSWYDLPQRGHHLCIHFKAPVAGGGQGLAIPLHAHLGRESHEAAEMIWRVARHHGARHTHPTYALSASAVLVELLLWLGRRTDPATTPRGELHSRRAVTQAARHIEENLHTPIPIPRLAQRVGLSQNYLARCFKKQYGQTLPGYALSRRVELAVKLLTTSDLPIKEIGSRVGVPDPQHFNKLIRRIVGQSPSQVRASGKPTGISG